MNNNQDNITEEVLEGKMVKAMLGSIVTFDGEQVTIEPCDIGECVISKSGSISYKKEISIPCLGKKVITTVFSILGTDKTITKEEFEKNKRTNFALWASTETKITTKNSAVIVSDSEGDEAFYLNGKLMEVGQPLGEGNQAIWLLETAEKYDFTSKDVVFICTEEDETDFPEKLSDLKLNFNPKSK